jgi:ABC-type antimicrobial peptide transport system permease subunit
MEKQQFIRVNNLGSYENAEELFEQSIKRIKEENVIDVFPVQYMSISVTSIIGMNSADMALTSIDKVDVLMDYFDAKLIEGRMPQSPGEIILDKKLCKNNNIQLNDKFKIDFTVVGIVESDYYFGTGIRNLSNNCISILSNGKGVDYSILAKELKFDNIVYDSVQGKKAYKEFIVDSIAASKMVINIGSLIVLCICLVIVINMYYRDRHEEWCLYHSIGFSSQNIFFVTLREMLIFFGLGLFVSVFIIGIGVTTINLLAVRPLGLLAREFIPEAIGSILASLAFVLGICQIPLFYAMNKIRTIDILEEEQ